MIARYYDVMNGKPQMFKQFCNNVDKSTFNIKNINNQENLLNSYLVNMQPIPRVDILQNIEHL